jgi:hypothetical protein
MKLMRRITTLVIILVVSMWSSMLLAGGEEPSQQPSAKERLNQVLGPEGGIQVYKDHQGNVQNTTVLPNGERIIKVQPPQSQGFNVGPPLQLNNQTLSFPPPPPPPAQPPAPEFPQKAR